MQACFPMDLGAYNQYPVTRKLLHHALWRKQQRLGDKNIAILHKSCNEIRKKKKTTLSFLLQHKKKHLAQSLGINMIQNTPSLSYQNCKA